ncbi:phosphatase PAP2 family protein [Terrimonas sp. NA20]|uniref:Phosphatase PAP2 family protein n=1 Tax=Terrimonas ginsenosidimutans TaxID=2908004 RepID=A0ABS9KNB3_9BACT|nr:phosphatase PAP2 family protein [Terrimonas ginsenosidimutans]MCG2613798.1 phosphatase PAP2 family protein [Terrimonas ginsenosidimutans]
MKKLALVSSFLVLIAQCGFCQQVNDSLVRLPSIERNRFSIRQLNVPVVMMGLGLAASGNADKSIKNVIKRQRNEHMADFRTHIDNYLQYAPIGIVYGLDAMGFKAKNDFANRTAILLKGEFMMLSTVGLIKEFSNQLRPDGSDRFSFPSGHTAQAFATATFLSMEYKDRWPWMPYAAYGMASSVGMMRMANNRHYISDVLLGAGIGILAMKASYWTHQYKWNRKKRGEMVTY